MKTFEILFMKKLFYLLLMNQPLHGLSKSNKITDKVMVNTMYKTVSECAK